MGQAGRCLSRTQQEDTFIQTSTTRAEPEHYVQFDIAESFLVSYGIDYQTHSKFKTKTLGPSTTADAREVVLSMANAGLILPTNAVLYEASKQPDYCTKSGMKRGFQAQARKVGHSGLFIFHFSGHGIRLKRSHLCGLAPVDFDYTLDKLLTANVLTSWLQEVGCKAKCILFTLDCCYAGGIGQDITASGQLDLIPGLYVLSACTGTETCLAIGPLGHSIFTYFLCRAISTTVQCPGQLPLRKIFTECQIPSVAMSSLIVCHSPLSGLQYCTMEPELKCLDRSAALGNVGEEVSPKVSTDILCVALKNACRPCHEGDALVPRFHYAITLYDCAHPVAPLEDQCIMWLHTAATKAIATLEGKCLLSDQQVLLAVLCSVLYSIASIEVASNSAKLQNPNHFITSYIHAVAAIGLVHHSVEFTQDHFMQGWQYYDEVVKTSMNGPMH